MKRNIITIDESKCDGCGICVDACMEGALQIIGGKARLITEFYCDGLGACIGECPQGAITMEEREAEPYDEIAVIDRLSKYGEKTILAHLRHLKAHKETALLNQALEYLRQINIFFEESKLDNQVMEEKKSYPVYSSCPGTIPVQLNSETTETSQSSALRQWPVQLHLVNPLAPYFREADVILTADCIAYCMGDFHNKYLKNKSIAIACPKLDSNLENYIEKIKEMIDTAKINTLTVMVMEVPCCSGLIKIGQLATKQSTRKIPLKFIQVSISGKVLNEEWVL
ncbi:MAG: ATP-binding protein [Ignavibacteria bacterium]